MIDGVLIENLMPLRAHILLAYDNTLLRASSTMRNRKGDKGHPWWSLWEALKNLDGDPLIRKN
jgi:hypothetical protein